MAWSDIKLPEGATAIPEPLQQKFLDVVNGNGTAKERAQALVDLQQEIYSAASETGSKAWDTLQEQWVNAQKALPDIGGANYDRNLAEVNRLVTQYGTPELNKVMKDTGMANHPEWFKFLHNLTKVALEPVPGGQGGNGGAPALTEAERLARRYPSSQPKT